MKRSAAFALLTLAACSTGNPWDTSGDAARLQAETEEDRKLELARPFNPPQENPVPRTDPDLEGWRDTVLARADAGTLDRLRMWSQMKLAALSTRRDELDQLEPRLQEPHMTQTLQKMEIETMRLQMIEDRIAEGLPR